MDVAIEVKSSQRIHRGHITSLKALLEEHKVKRAIIVSLEKHPRKLENNIEVLLWQTFLKALWSVGIGV
ncbi:MAG: hypothetical protein ACMUJM_03835 [bacterium]